MTQIQPLDSFFIRGQRAWSLFAPQEWDGKTSADILGTEVAIGDQTIRIGGMERFVIKLDKPLVEGEPLSVMESK